MGPSEIAPQARLLNVRVSEEAWQAVRAVAWVLYPRKQGGGLQRWMEELLAKELGRLEKDAEFQTVFAKAYGAQLAINWEGDPDFNPKRPWVKPPTTSGNRYKRRKRHARSRPDSKPSP